MLEHTRQQWLVISFILMLVGGGAHSQLVKAMPGPQTVTMRFVRTEVATVLTALATQVGFDVVIGSDVEGPIDLNLHDVDWRTALAAIVDSRGLSYHWNDDVLVVLSTEEQNRGALVHRVINLQYGDPLAVQQAVAGVLSPRGKVETLGNASAGAQARDAAIAPVLIVSDLSHRLPAIVDLIDSLDVPRPQFEIAVRFIETDIDDQSAYGFNWPTRITATVADYSAGDGTSSGSDNTARTPAAEYPIPDGKIWRFGTLSFDQVTGFLEALSQNGRAHLLSDPRVTVLENQRAQIKVTTTYPVQTLSRFTEGTIIQDIVEYQDLEVGITLTVIPRLNADGLVTLEVEPVVEEVTGFTGVPGNERPITANRTVKTFVRVRDGETLVIGGLIRETDFVTESSVFLLGDIPLLGALFKHKKVEQKKQDLLIFITPKILPG